MDYTDRVGPLLAEVHAFWSQQASPLYAAVRALPVAKLQIGDLGWDPWDYERVMLRLGLSFDTMLAFDPLSVAGVSPGEGAPEPRFAGGDPDTERFIYAYLMLRSLEQVALADTPLPLLVVMPCPEPTREEVGLEDDTIDDLIRRILSDVFSPHAPLHDLDDWLGVATEVSPSRLASMLDAAPELSGFFGGERPCFADLVRRHQQDLPPGAAHVLEMLVPITLMFDVVPSFLLQNLREAFAVRQGAAVSTALTWPGTRTLDDLVALRRSDRLEDVRQLTRSLMDRSSGDRSAHQMDRELRRLASTLADRGGTAARPAEPRDGPTLEPHPATFAAACSSWCTPSPAGDRPPRPLALLDAVRDV
ncbi:MAG: hypothetical protein ACK4YP_17545 [Myxococcota bacterium]